MQQLQGMLLGASSTSSAEWLDMMFAAFYRPESVVFGITGPMCIELNGAMAHSTIDDEIQLDSDHFYPTSLRLSTAETLILYSCFGVSLLCFSYSSFLLIEALIHFGLNRCQRQLQMWKQFLASKHCRL